MTPADFVEYFFIYRLAVDRLTCGLKLFDYGLHHVPLNLLILCNARLSFTEPAEIFVNSHDKLLSVIFRFSYQACVVYEMAFYTCA